TDERGYNFSHERARFYLGSSALVGTSPAAWLTLNSSTEVSKFDIAGVSPKLKGYYSGNIIKTTLHIDSYDATSGTLIGYLCEVSGVSYVNKGPVTVGKLGNTVRFYDHTYIDY